MHNRCLSRNDRNIVDLDIYIRNNTHVYDAFVYGFQQDKNIAVEIDNTFKSSFLMKVLLYLYSGNINNTMLINDIVTSVAKCTAADILMSFNSTQALICEKIIQAELIKTLGCYIYPAVNVTIKPQQVETAFMLGTLTRGNVLRDIEDYIVSDIESIKMSDLTADTPPVYGLKTGLVKQTKIADIQDSTIELISDNKIEQLNYVKIY